MRETCPDCSRIRLSFIRDKQTNEMVIRCTWCGYQPADKSFNPKTDLGERLLMLREKAIKAGTEILSEAEVLQRDIE